MKTDLEIFTENIDADAVNQVYELLAQPPFAGAKVRVMPDAHYGKGCVVGFTATLGDKIIPNVLGVDLGCGMLTVELGKVEIDLPALDKFIRQKIPAGSRCRKEVNGEHLIKQLRCFADLREMDRLYGSLGTLGGGNHFIEVDEDDEGNKYLVIHSGSRNLGLQVANLYQHRAIDACKNAAMDERQKVIDEWNAKGMPEKIPEAIDEVTKKYAHKTKIPNAYCYLEGEDMQAYLHDLKLCQQFASESRKKMADDILKHLKIRRYMSFETVHNFIDEDNIVRKGAIPAHAGQKVLIPMNMRDGCLICIGKGNPDWNESAPHGAGRLYKRSAVKDLFTLEEYQAEMQGVYTTAVSLSTLDESPMAYKPMEEIVRLIAPTVEIVGRMKPIYNFKAGE